MFLTIFTPTYNRAKTLFRLYTSLVNQSNKNFEWVVVDDGSTDDTQDLIESWIEEDHVSIYYVSQKNGGKNRATGKGIEIAKGYLFFCVDSDDYLPPEAVETIISYWHEYDKNEYAGILALKQSIQGYNLGDDLPPDVVCCSTYELTSKYNSRGERALIYKTSILRDFFVPSYVNENFLTESVMYDSISQHYNMLLLNRILTICEYQKDGYSNKNQFSIMLNNPCGYCHYYAQRIDMAIGLQERIGYIIRYLAFRNISHKIGYKYQGKYKKFVSFLHPFSFIPAVFYKIKA